jgi:hypothetical protein
MHIHAYPIHFLANFFLNSSPLLSMFYEISLDILFTLMVTCSMIIARKLRRPTPAPCSQLRPSLTRPQTPSSLLFNYPRRFVLLPHSRLLPHFLALFCTFLHVSKTYLPCFQSHPHSLRKTSQGRVQRRQPSCRPESPPSCVCFRAAWDTEQGSRGPGCSNSPLATHRSPLTLPQESVILRVQL